MHIKKLSRENKKHLISLKLKTSQHLIKITW